MNNQYPFLPICSIQPLGCRKGSTCARFSSNFDTSVYQMIGNIYLNIWKHSFSLGDLCFGCFYLFVLVWEFCLFFCFYVTLLQQELLENWDFGMDVFFFSILILVPGMQKIFNICRYIICVRWVDR